MLKNAAAQALAAGTTYDQERGETTHPAGEPSTSRY